jgi:xylulokinase
VLGGPLLMGIDIGTQSTRVALLDLAGHVVSSASTPQEMVTPRPGWAEQDPDVWWGNVQRSTRQVTEQTGVAPREVLAVGVCGQMHATIPLGKDGQLLSHGVQLWCDKRSADLVNEFKLTAEVDAAMRLAGNPPVANWLGFNIQWLRVHTPDLYERTWKFVPCKDYVNYRLTGEITTDWSEASGSFMMDTKTKTWSPELVGYLGLDMDKLPDVHASSDVVGEVTAEAAELTGLAEGTPVVAGGGDMLCTLISSGVIEPGRASDITGTSSILSVFVEEPVLDPRLMNLHHVMPGWIPFGITDSGGGALRWFKDNLCQGEAAEARRLGEGVYDILNTQAAAAEPGSEGLLFFPYLMGERTLGTPSARGVFFGLTLRTTKGAMVRAIMEGVTFELRRTLEIVEAAGEVVCDVCTIGGGARSDLWSQIKADIYKRPVHTLEASEGGILGSAILAGVGVGVYEGVRTGAEQCLRIKRAFQPNPATAERYDFLYEVFKEVHDELQEPFDRLERAP